MNKNWAWAVPIIAALLAMISSVLSAYITGNMLLKQNYILLQQAREKIIGENAYKELVSIRRLSFELYCLSEILILDLEKEPVKDHSSTIKQLCRKSNELFFQSAYPFGMYAKGISEAAIALKERGAAVKYPDRVVSLKYAVQQFETSYSHEMASYQRFALPGKLPNDVLNRMLMVGMEKE